MPHRWSEPLAQANHAASLSRNQPLQESPPEKQREHLNATRQVTIHRLLSLRGVIFKSFLSMASALAVAWAFRVFYGGPMLPRGVFALGSVFCFAWATLARLGWRGQTWLGDTSVERLDQRILHVLYWIGMCWAALAVL